MTSQSFSHLGLLGEGTFYIFSNFPKMGPESLLPIAENPCSASLEAGMNEYYMCFLCSQRVRTHSAVCVHNHLLER